MSIHNTIKSNKFFNIKIKEEEKKILAVMLFCIMVIPLYYAYNHYSNMKSSDTTIMNSEQQKLTTKKRELRTVKDTQIEFLNFKKNYPRDNRETALLKTLMKITELTKNVQVLKMEPKLDISEKDEILQIPMTIEVITSYDQLLKLLSEIKKSNSFMYVRNLVLKNEDNQIKCNFDIVTLAKPYAVTNSITTLNNLEINNQAVSNNPFGLIVDLDANRKDIQTQQANAITGMVPGSDKISSVDVGVAGVSTNNGSNSEDIAMEGFSNKQTSSTNESSTNESSTDGFDSSQGTSTNNSNVQTTKEDKGFTPIKTTAIISKEYGISNDTTSGKKTFNYGVDIQVNENTSVYSVMDGTVVYIGNLQQNNKCVMIRHYDGTTSFYGNLNNIYVSNGDIVSADERIGACGKKGKQSEPYVHFGYAINNKFIDPVPYLSSKYSK